MTAEPHHKSYGTTATEWIAMTPNELPHDAVGLWQIVANGRRGFCLEGAALADFVRCSVAAVVGAGAVPVRGINGQKGKFWEPQRGYGDLPDTIAANVVAEWIAAGQQVDPGGLWFALPALW